MLYFIYGQDSYLLKKALKELVFNLQKKNYSPKIEIKRIDAEKENFKEIFFQMNNLELFTNFKILILEQIFKNALAENFLEEFLKKTPKLPQNYALIILEQGIPNKNSKLFNLLLKKAVIQECHPLHSWEVFEFAKKEFLKNGAQIKLSALKELIARTGNNLWQISNEIKKLSTAIKGRVILKKDVALYVKDIKDSHIFETIEALALNQKAKALKLISRHLQQGENSLYLFSMVVYQFRVLIQLKDLLERKFSLFQIQKKTSLHPLVLKKALVPAKLFSQEKLNSLYRQLANLDFQIKVGNITPETALELFLTKF